MASAVVFAIIRQDFYTILRNGREKREKILGLFFPKKTLILITCEQGISTVNVHGIISTLPEISLPENSELRQAVASLVKAKDYFDFTLNSHLLSGLIPHGLRNGISCESLGTIDVPIFANAVIPFLDFSLSRDNSVGSGEDAHEPLSKEEKSFFCGKLCNKKYARVPLDCLIGQSWKWWPEHVINPDELKLNLSDDGCVYGCDRAIIYVISPLGFCLAHEGKNRVAFLRSQGVSHVPAEVRIINYPSPDRLRLYWIPMDDGDKIWCVLDDEKALPLVLDDLTKNMLCSYGVQAVSAWPRSLPAKDEVLKAWRERSSDWSKIHQNYVDLDVLGEQLRSQKKSQEFIKVSFAGIIINGLIKGFIKLHQKALAITAIATFSFVGCRILFSCFRDFKQHESWIFFGACVLFLFFPLLKVPRNLIEDLDEK